MKPLPAAVARSNGQTWAVESRATARASLAGRAAGDPAEAELARFLG